MESEYEISQYPVVRILLLKSIVQKKAGFWKKKFAILFILALPTISYFDYKFQSSTSATSIERKILKNDLLYSDSVNGRKVRMQNIPAIDLNVKDWPARKILVSQLVKDVESDLTVLRQHEKTSRKWGGQVVAQSPRPRFTLVYPPHANGPPT